LEAFALSAGVIFLAELGDKSQLMAMAFAARYRFWPVMIGITGATLLVHAGSVLIGRVAAAALPVDVISLAAGAAYLGFALWTIRGDQLGDEDEARASRVGRWAIVAIGTSFFLAELGDKTMLATVTLGATNEPIGTWLGSTAGMVLADALAVGAGSLLATRLSPRIIARVAAASFVIFGLLLVYEGVRGLIGA
jgi:putative Ca2+/H+ antiporter (TMEM165/GDT1 family)